jgi:predicted transcriptional regulator
VNRGWFDPNLDAGKLIHDKKVMSSPESKNHWTFLSNHAQVLLCIARDPQIRIRDIAQSVGITERAAQRIVSDLADAGYIERERIGRRSHYRLNGNVAMRHVAQADYDINELLKAFPLPTESSGDSR